MCIYIYNNLEDAQKKIQTKLMYKYIFREPENIENSLSTYK